MSHFAFGFLSAVSASPPASRSAGMVRTIAASLASSGVPLMASVAPVPPALIAPAVMAAMPEGLF
ncbi:hypothetical protein [Treponema endosymbiont of Eucomonympha sp.]|uniref:hypothetical protein n=1 Tax=Treponema endosymbiont of Eucomonympha sp. TaxID=1580831 RepID=UPI0013968E3F|nr:hypothetical protein [Treponema endosymbiont of Eucomonympha sp.]